MSASSLYRDKTEYKEGIVQLEGTYREPWGGSTAGDQPGAAPFTATL